MLQFVSPLFEGRRTVSVRKSSLLLMIELHSITNTLRAAEELDRAASRALVTWLIDIILYAWNDIILQLSVVYVYLDMHLTRSWVPSVFSRYLSLLQFFVRQLINITIIFRFVWVAVERYRADYCFPFYQTEIRYTEALYVAYNILPVWMRKGISLKSGFHVDSCSII